VAQLFDMHQALLGFWSCGSVSSVLKIWAWLRAGTAVLRQVKLRHRHSPHLGQCPSQRRQPRCRGRSRLRMARAFHRASRRQRRLRHGAVASDAPLKLPSIRAIRLHVAIASPQPTMTTAATAT